MADSTTLSDLIAKQTQLLEKYDYAFFLLNKKSGDYSEQLRLATEDAIKQLKAEIADLDVEATITKLRGEAKTLEIELQEKYDSLDLDAIFTKLDEKVSEAIAQLEDKYASIDIDTVLQQIKDDTDVALAKIDEKIATVGGTATFNLEVVDTKLLKLNTMSDSYAPRGNSTYRSMFKVNERVFAMATLLYSGTSSNYTEATITPFFVNEDGTISESTPKQVFGNTSGRGISTTQFFSVEGTGKLFAYGNNCYPGQSSHKFGYFYGRVDESGNVANTGSATNSDYHIANGQYGGMGDGDGNGFYAVGASYSSSNSKARHVRINYDGNTPSLGVINPSSNTSTCYASHIIPQKGVSNTNIVGIVHFRTNSSSYKERAYNSSGSYSDYTIPTWDSEMVGFVLSTGAVLNVTRGNSGYRACVYGSYNSRTVINDFELDSNYFYCYWSRADITNVGNDIWLAYNYQAKMVFSFHIDPNSYKVTIIDSAFVGMSVGNNSTTSLKVAGANNEFLVVCSHSSSASDLVKVLRNPLKMTIGEE